ncbi:hypothetical protein DVH24_031250 [Malus domestica]|uniref:Checkpoint protein n=1 Tax=Malus domestica TaxID=3750 RepID=A0A498HHR6_MALDO|nr:hypothetical protein DVH24_031250 [Malus domestica]
MKRIAMASATPTHLPTYTQLQSFRNPAPIALFESCNSMYYIKQIHAQAVKTGLTSHPIVRNRIIVFCCTDEFGDVNYARQVFDAISEPGVFLWNTMIRGYSRIRCPQDGVSLYLAMQRMSIKPDCYTFPFLLKGFTREIALECGKELHAHVLKYGLDTNVFVQNALVHMYSVCGLIDMARGVFDTIHKKDVATWNVMISGYNRIKKFDESLKLFSDMEKTGALPTSVTLVSVISACSKLKNLDAGKQVHKYVKDCLIKPDLVLGNALVDMYVACGEMHVALEIFEKMKTKDVISWTTIVKGFASSGQVDLARSYFDEMPERDYISWTAIMDGYLRVNRFKEALELFRQMQTSNVKPDEYTMSLTQCVTRALAPGQSSPSSLSESSGSGDCGTSHLLTDPKSQKPSFLRSETRTDTHQEMKFKAFLTENGVNLLEKRFLPALDKMGKICHLYLNRDHAIFLHNLLNGDGIQSIAQFRKEALFDDYRISSQNEDRIAFTVDISLLHRALRSSVSICTEFGNGPTANRLQIRLVKKLPPNSTQPLPFLTFETKGYKSAVIQDVPISKPLSRAQVLELQTALDAAQDLPQTLVQVPDLNQLQNFVDRMRHVGDLLNVTISKYGDLHIQISTTLITLGAEFQKLLVIGEQADAPSEDRNLTAQTRSARAILRGDAQSVQVSVKHFGKSLQCHLAKPDCAFYGIAAQGACLTVIFQFFIPGSHQIDKSISLHCRLPVLDQGSG